MCRKKNVYFKAVSIAKMKIQLPKHIHVESPTANLIRRFLIQLRGSGPPQAHFRISGSSGSSPKAKHFASVSWKGWFFFVHGSFTVALRIFQCFFTQKNGGKNCFAAPNRGQIHVRYINAMYTDGVYPGLKSIKSSHIPMLDVTIGVPSSRSS